MREATLRVSSQTSAGPPASAETPATSPAEVRLSRDLELSLEPRPPVRRASDS
jgi:hypothetical protein